MLSPLSPLSAGRRAVSSSSSPQVVFSDAVQSPKAFSPKHRSHPHRPVTVTFIKRVDPSDPEQLCPARLLYAPNTPESNPSLASTPATRSILKPTGHPNALADSLTEGTRLNSGDRKHTLGLFELRYPMSHLSIKSALGPLKTFATVTQGAIATLKSSLLPSEPVDVLAVPAAIGARDVEHAYSILYTKMRAWACSEHAKSLSSEDAQAIQEACTVLGACLSRDLDAVLVDDAPVSPPATSSSPVSSPLGAGLRPSLAVSPLRPSVLFPNHLPVPSSSSPNPFQQASPSAAQQKRGRSDADIRKFRLRIDAAQSGLQCMAVLFYYPVYFQHFTESLEQLLHRTMGILLQVRAFRQPKDREIVAFVIYVLGCLRFSEAVLEPHAALIAESIVGIYTNRARANGSWSKSRRPEMEALTAISKLCQHYPRLFARRFLSGRSDSVLTLFQSLTAASSAIRTRAIAAFGGIAYGLWTNWPDRSANGMMQRSRLIAELSRNVAEFLLKGHRDHFVMLWSAAETRSEEVPWLLNSMAVMPVLLGRRLKELEQGKFHGDCLRAITICLNYDNQAVRKAAFVAWSHYIFANVLAASADGDDSLFWLSGVKAARSTCAFQNMAQVWRPTQGGMVPPSAECLTCLMSLAYGLTNLVLTSQLNHEQLLFRLSRIWQELVATDLMYAIQCDKTEMAIVHECWRALDAILSYTNNTQRHVYKPERMLAPGLMVGAFNTALEADRLMHVAQSDADHAVAGADLPAFPSIWVLHSFDQAVEVLLASLERAGQALYANESPASLEYGAPAAPCPTPLQNVWKSLVLHLQNSHSAWHASISDPLLRAADLLKRRIEVTTSSRAEILAGQWCSAFVNVAIEELLAAENSFPDFLFALQQLTPTWKLKQALDRLEQDQIVDEAQLISLSADLSEKRGILQSPNDFVGLYERLAMLWTSHWQKETFDISMEPSDEPVQPAFAQFIQLGIDAALSTSTAYQTMLATFASGPAPTVSSLLLRFGLVSLVAPGSESQAAEQERALAVLVPAVLKERARANLTLPQPLLKHCRTTCTTWQELKSQQLLTRLIHALESLSDAQQIGFWLEELHSIFLHLFQSQSSVAGVQGAYARVVRVLRGALADVQIVDQALLDKWQPMLVSVWADSSEEESSLGQRPEALEAVAQLWRTVFGARGVQPRPEEERLVSVLMLANHSYPELLPVEMLPFAPPPSQDMLIDEPVSLEHVPQPASPPPQVSPEGPGFFSQDEASASQEQPVEPDSASQDGAPAPTLPFVMSTPCEDFHPEQTEQIDDFSQVESQSEPSLLQQSLRRSSRKRKAVAASPPASKRKRTEIIDAPLVLRPVPVNSQPSQVDESPRRKKQRFECVEVVLRPDLSPSPRRKKGKGFLRVQSAQTLVLPKGRSSRRTVSEADVSADVTKYVFPFPIDSQHRGTLIVTGDVSQRTALASAKAMVCRAFDYLQQGSQSQESSLS